MKGIFWNGAYLAPILPGSFSTIYWALVIVPVLGKWLTSVTSFICHKITRRWAFLISVYRNRDSGSLCNFHKAPEARKKQTQNLRHTNLSKERFEKKVPCYRCHLSVALTSVFTRELGREDSPRTLLRSEDLLRMVLWFLTKGREGSCGGRQAASKMWGNPTGTGPACFSWDFQKKEQNTPYDMCGSFPFSLLCLEEMNEERDESG